MNTLILTIHNLDEVTKVKRPEITIEIPLLEGNTERGAIKAEGDNVSISQMSHYSHISQFSNRRKSKILWNFITVILILGIMGGGVSLSWVYLYKNNEPSI